MTTTTQQPLDGLAGFSQEDRDIFRYFDGEKAVAADPLRLNQDVIGYPGLNLVDDLAAMQASSPELAPLAREAYLRVIGAIRAAFKIKPFAEQPDGTRTGLLDEECLRLFGAFGAYIDGLKKKRGLSPTSPSVTDLEDSADPSAMPTSADSTSTAIESPADVPCPSPSV